MTRPAQPDHPDISTDCRGGKHPDCFGYISPLISGRDRPCQDVCHTDGSGREPDFNLALAVAELRRQRTAPLIQPDRTDG